MERDLFAWADLAMGIVQGVALAVILWQLFYLRRSLLAMLRVLRGAANLLTGTERLDASGFARLWTRGAGPDERGGPSEGRTTLSNVTLSQPN
jgi:hypothetical protein